jgi:hypothetical protein
LLLITSAAYIGSELRSELGKIPPAFLPVGNQRLYCYQRKILQSDERIILTVPKSFQVPAHDLKQIESMEIELLKIPDDLSLSDSVICALNLSGYSEGLLTILHGDTLVYDVPPNLTDVVAVSKVEDNYEWATFDGNLVSEFNPYEKNAHTVQQVVNGYFRFSDTSLFIEAMQRAHGSFIDGINNYSQRITLKAYLTEGWYDFGHLHTYFRSKTHISTSRAFNLLQVHDGVVTKRSNMPNKMAAESTWFKQLPRELRKFTPKYLGDIEQREELNGYQIEYQCISSLNELLVFGDLPPFIWGKIIKVCQNFISKCQQHPSPLNSTETFKNFLRDKTESRLKNFTAETQISLSEPWRFNNQELPSILNIHNASIKHVPDATQQNVVHGDFCFSNILYDFRSQNIKVIDPRGLDSAGELSIFGFTHYDIAKLAHSILGSYDFIIAGYFKIERQHQNLNFTLFNEGQDKYAEQYFKNLCLEQFNLNELNLCALQIQLFLSMLPLHSDKPNRQLALLANAMRLYKKMESLT